MNICIRARPVFSHITFYTEILIWKVDLRTFSLGSLIKKISKFQCCKLVNLLIYVFVCKLYTTKFYCCVTRLRCTYLVLDLVGYCRVWVLPYIWIPGIGYPRVTVGYKDHQKIFQKWLPWASYILIFEVTNVRNSVCPVLNFGCIHFFCP